MSSDKGSSSTFLTTKTSGPTIESPTSLDHYDASVSTSKSQKGSSFMLETWVNAPTSLDPWSPVKAIYSSKR
ncbi:hypothetical protein Pdw03_5853 [Penicillium digitatum]|uniref:Uncharacterized protein n=1 Tax=Penicillium digitatum TaxID=36651 RepID=A0A7T6XVN2_PENDI|nr:hypothetical protein PDIDSM_1427 [Penicillium digitatum]QQK48218.1 hypothetical protein Pdw03_5853 [Penicillium digitatum]